METKEKIKELVKGAKSETVGMQYLEILTETINLCTRELNEFFRPAGEIKCKP